MFSQGRFYPDVELVALLPSVPQAKCPVGGARRDREQAVCTQSRGPAHCPTQAHERLISCPELPTGLSTFCFLTLQLLGAALLCPHTGSARGGEHVLTARKILEGCGLSSCRQLWSWPVPLLCLGGDLLRMQKRAPNSGREVCSPPL